MGDNQPDLIIDESRQYAGSAEDESQTESRNNKADAISDDQELFLKVLENLKNAVTKPESHLALPKKPATHKEETYVHSASLTSGALISEHESQNYSTRSDGDEPGTTTVTVSDITKSRILQKLACERAATSAENVRLRAGEHMTLPVVTQLHAPVATKEITGVSVSNFGGRIESDSGTQKALYTSRPVSFVKTNLTKTSDKSERVNQKQSSSSVQLYPCNYCDYYSDNKSYLKQHVDFVHISDRPFKCPYCEYAGKRSHALREHLIVHTDERPFQCTVCKATFRKKGHLTNHVKLHNSKRLVKCPLCKALVYDTGENGLDAHLKNDHDTERLYGCDLCDHIAANEPDIIKHLRQTHKTQIVSHKCEKCPYETANSTDFTAHTNAHKLADTNVNIGEGSPTKVLGVATIPKGSEDLGVPNTLVKMTNVEPSQTGLPKQPAVIKPVWIKCSECGFTGQDSEVIRTHMLEHLKEQGLEVVTEDKTYVPQPISAKLSTFSTEPKQTVTHLPNRLERPPNSKTPILVPVTNIDFLPKHAGKIDMNSPILVPVTDTEMLKRLQQSAIHHIGTKAQVTTTAAAQNSTQMPIMTATSASDILRQKNRLPISVEKEIVSTDVQSSTPQPMVIFPNISNASGQTVVKFPHVIERVTQDPNIKVIPMSSNSGIISSARSLQAVISSSVMSSPGSSQTMSVLQGTGIESLQTLGKNQPVHSFSLTRIPVPRTDAPTSPPKLPPELMTSTTPVADGKGDIEKRTGQKVPVQGRAEQANEETLLSLKESLANVQRLIEEQEKLSKRVGGGSLVKIDPKDVASAQSSGKNVVFYVEPVPNQNLAGKSHVSSDFTHDSTVGRFKCTLCGYTCEHQRTIKAHVWKHSGNKNIDYPMFQNGPLSVYDDELPTRIERNEKVIEIITSSNEVNKAAMTRIPPLVKSFAEVESAKVPPFIVYENTKISNVAPALAHLIAARTMAGMKKKDGDIDSTTSESSETEHLSDPNAQVGNQEANTYDDEHSNKENSTTSSDSTCSQLDVLSPPVTEVITTVSKNVVVESIADATSSEGYTGYTGLQSQQNSPRVGARSPDSGITEMTVRTAEDTTSLVSSELKSPVSYLENMSSEVSVLRSGRKRSMRQHALNVDTSDAAENCDDPLGMSSSKKVKVLQAHEDSAVTLLSLLKKGPNYNPACPPMSSNVTQPSVIDYSNVSSPGQDDSNSIEESEMSGSKPKSGISTSLLAVIEQLRERSKSDADDEKPLPPPAKKTSKRRSRKSSQEDNTPASGIENVEEFSIDGEVKFRCKLCHYTNESTVLLRQHMRLHKPKQEFECSLCDLIAESSEALQDHMIQHCKVRTYQCKLCNSTFNYKSQLRAHMRMHNDQDILFCDFCDFETRNLAGMKLHTKSHLTKPPYKCDNCQEDFVSSYNLRIHKRDGCNTSLDKSNTSFKCDECDFVFFGRREMKNHLRHHMGRSKAIVPNRCPYCEHSDSSIENIQKHVADIHGESKPLKCEMCGFFAVSIRSLKSHMKRHVNDQRFVAQPLEQYKCNLCGYVCHHLPSLKSHMWRHAADQHYSYEFTNDVINAAIDFDGQTDVSETTAADVDNFKIFIFEKMKAKGLENTHGTLEESAIACCWVTFRCCQCGFETINKAELNLHMSAHSDVIKMTLEIGDQTVIIDNQGNEVEVS